MSEPMISQIAAEACGAAYRHVRSFGTETAALADAMRTSIEDDTRPKSISRWMAAHDGQTVATTQFKVDQRSQEVRHVWEPPVRTINARQSFVILIEPDGVSYSHRYYLGIRSVRSTDSVFIGYDYSMSTLIVYRVVTA